MAQTIQGIRDADIQACTKHFIGNEQEHERETMSNNIDDRTLYELYLWPVADAVKANVASVMCSYTKLNQTWACKRDHVLNGVLKNELDFPGNVVRFNMMPARGSLTCNNTLLPATETLSTLLAQPILGLEW